MRVAVTGGKGGTGKSFVAVNVAVEASLRGVRTVLIDLDLEAPNDHVLLGVGPGELGDGRDVVLFLPFINYRKCTACGVCGRVCDTGAILVPPRGFPVVFPRLCSGCRACFYACPYDAIDEGGHVLARSYVTRLEDYGGLVLVTGMLVEGEEHVPPGVVVVKRRGLGVGGDLYVVDTGAGTGSAISIAVEGSDVVLAVTEPTPMGAHDLDAVLEVVEGMGLEAWVVVNKYGIGDPGVLEPVLERHRVGRVYRVPFSRVVVESYVRGVPLVYGWRGGVEARVFERIVDDLLGVSGG